MKAAFLIAAPSSGSGKTTIARGLMALFTRQGYRVQPFKCGPDYIDTKFHAAVCGRPSVNLDTFMTTPAHVRELFYHYGDDADVCIVEGMMGLFDGYDRERGSCYEIATLLDIPIVLVVDARSAAYSMTALLQGFLHFREDARFAGVIFNKVGSNRHAALLREVAEEAGIACLGCIPKQAALEQNSRYLGLDFSEMTTADEWVKLLERKIEVRNLMGCLTRDTTISHTWEKVFSRVIQTNAPCFVARNNESFSFIYQETLDMFAREHELIFFNPETEVPELQDATLLYLPGGYPEKHLKELVLAEKTRRVIRDYALCGGRIIAECGGMMYLCKSIVTDDGEYPMCGVLPYSITAREADRHLSLGYRRFELDGHEYRGHEFHYTQFLSDVPSSVTQVCNAKGEPVATPVFRVGNVLASYTHLYPEYYI